MDYCQCEQPLIRCDQNGCHCMMCNKPERSVLMDREEETFVHGIEVTEVGANAVQIGGEHYRSEYQHWDFIELNGIGYLEAAATKYATRWRKKNGREDLEKALHYLDKLEELHATGRRLPRGVAPLAEVQRFADANNLSEDEQIVVHDLSRWDCGRDLHHARSAILRLLDESDIVHPPSITQEHPFGFDKEQDVGSEQQ